ncbi:MAG: DivIVA domain-containing protein [Firmicutes bacterium]|nr:DivIVA domain-containing protein [Bacillota bacterium]
MLTPLDIQNKEFRRRLRGYCENEVDEFLDQVLESYETLYRQNANLKDEVFRLNEEVNRYRKLEETLQDTLVLAQKAADETRANAQKEADLIRAQAKADAEGLEQKAQRRLAELTMELADLQGKVEEYKARTRALFKGAMALLETKDLNTKEVTPNADE